MKTLLHIWRDEDGMFSIANEFSFKEMNAAQMVPGIEDAMMRCGPEVYESVSYLFLAYFGAATKLDELPARKRGFRLRDQKSSNPELLKELVSWRRRKAEEKKLPPYCIMSNRVLFGISEIAPLTDEALLAISGFGPVMLDRYGDEILEMTSSFPMSDNECEP